MQDKIKAIFNESAELKKKVADELTSNIDEAVKLVINCYRNKGKVLICGNGGSAADAQHFAAELVNRFKIERKPLPCIALTTDTSILTCVANDSAFDDVFEKQINAFCSENDILIVITTSDVETALHGHSANIAKAVSAAKQKGAKTIGLLSVKGEKIGSMVDLALKVPSNDTPRIQEAHITILHVIAELVEKEMFKQ